MKILIIMMNNIYKMFCNSDLHNELINMDEGICPFCENILIEGYKMVELCCSKQNMANKNGMNVCLNCGLVHSCEHVIGYLDFYENMYKIHKKSIYKRKYHIENTLNSICYENKITLTYKQRDKIYKTFEIIGSVIPSVNKLRRRIISTKYILRHLFKLLDLPFECIKITKSRKTLEFYNRYWAKILELKFNSIIHIIRQ